MTNRISFSLLSPVLLFSFIHEVASMKVCRANHFGVDQIFSLSVLDMDLLPLGPGLLWIIAQN